MPASFRHLLMLAAALLLPVQSFARAADCRGYAPPEGSLANQASPGDVVPCHDSQDFPVPQSDDEACPHCASGLACTPSAALISAPTPLSLLFGDDMRLDTALALPSPESNPDRLDRPPRSR